MRTTRLLISLATAGALVACSDSVPLISEADDIVVQAYLYAGEPLDDVRVTATIPIDSDTTGAPPINDASILVTVAGTAYELVPSAGDSGYYHYPGEDFVALPGDAATLHVASGEVLASAETVVPAPPTGIAISDTLLGVAEIAGMGPSALEDMDEIEVTWTNEGDNLHFVVIECLEENPEPVVDDGMVFFKGGVRRFVSQPTTAEQYRIRGLQLTYIGRHKAILYRVNQEYADLYVGREQDSRDLNEPLTNIENGLGVFSAFAGDSVFFHAYRE